MAGGSRAPLAGLDPAAFAAAAGSMTVREVIVVAAAMLCAESPGGAAHVSDVVLACHRARPESFGLRDRPEWPCSNRVLCKLSGPGGVGATGSRMLDVGWPTVTVTDAGLAFARGVLRRVGAEPAAPAMPAAPPRAPRRRAAPGPAAAPEPAPALQPRAPIVVIPGPAPWPLCGSPRNFSPAVRRAG